MNPHPYFREQIASDRRQALTEQADTHRLLKASGPARESTRRSALGRWLRRRPRKVAASTSGIPSTAPHPLPPQ
jgi:hypothetical protein